MPQALLLSDPMTDISIAMEIDYFRLARDRYFVPLAVKIPGSELKLAQAKGVEKTPIDFIGRVKDDNRRQEMQNVREAMDIKLKGDNAAHLSKRPIAYDTGFSFPRASTR